MKSFRELTAIGKVFAIAYLAVLLIGIGMSLNYIQSDALSNQQAQAGDLIDDSDKNDQGNTDQVSNEDVDQNSDQLSNQNDNDSDDQSSNDTTNDQETNSEESNSEPGSSGSGETGSDELYTHEDLEKLRSAIVVIAFNHQSFKLNENEQHELDDFISILKLYPEEKIAVEGHANGYPLFENTTLEIALSQSRAESVKSYLINHGIMESQITIVNFGSSLPLSKNESEQSLNDRVVVYSVDHVMSEGEGK